MKTINQSFGIGLILLTAVVFVYGCSQSKDPLAGWKPYDSSHLDKAIVDDYKDFIAKNRLDLLGTISGYENGTGQHAIEFEAFPPDQNATWHYALIYDSKNNRLKVTKYGYHRFQS